MNRNVWIGGIVIAAFSFAMGRITVLPGKRVDFARENQQVHGDKPERRHEDRQLGRGKDLWTCAMHPQIKLPKAGKCPICGMDLVAVEVENGSASNAGMWKRPRLKMSPEAVALANIATAEVRRMRTAKTVRMVGKIDYDETRVRTIASWVPGRIDRLYVDYTGVDVGEGDHLVSIYSPELRTAQEELLHSIVAERELRSSKVSVLRQSTRRTVAAAREKLRLLGLTSGQITAIERKGEASDYITVYSPIGGTVVRKSATEGAYVETGTEIYRIADLSKVWVQLDAYESDMAWIRYGQDLEFTTEAYPGEVFHGRVSFIDPILNPKTRTVKLRVNVDNADGRLKPEMFVRATLRAGVAAGGRVMDPVLSGKWIGPMHPEIVRDQPGSCPLCGMDLARAEDLGYVPSSAETLPLVIPARAPLMTGERAVVYVRVGDGEEPMFEGREVVLGARTGTHYIVKAGLVEGEEVVVKGNFKIDSALQIQARPSMMHSPGDAGDDDREGGESARQPRGSM